MLGQQFPRDRLGVAQRPNPDGDVEILGEQIDVAVVDAKSRTKDVRTVQEPGRRPIKLHPPYIGTGPTRIYNHRRTRPEDSPTFKVAY